MAKESFDEAEIAEYLNEHYITIKVDREQRPDIDDRYMSAVRMMSGEGGATSFPCHPGCSFC